MKCNICTSNNVHSFYGGDSGSVTGKILFLALLQAGFCRIEIAFEPVRAHQDEIIEIDFAISVNISGDF